MKHDDQQTTDDYAYDQHGNILQMLNIPTMQWDYQNQLSKTISGTVTAFYNYDAGGERARKVAEKSGGIKEERIYFGNFEVYRKYFSDILETEWTTLHI